METYNERIDTFEESYDGEIRFTEDTIRSMDNYETYIESLARQERSRYYTETQDILPEVTIDDAINWANKKGYEIINFLQVLVQPFAIIVFIISALFTLVGSIGRGDLSGRGLWGMVVSVIVYAMVLYAPVIIKAFVSFLTT